MATTTTTRGPKRMWTGASFGAAVARSRQDASFSRWVKQRKTTGARLPYQIPAPMARPRTTGLTEVKSFDCVVAGGVLPLTAAAAGAEPGAAFAGLCEVNNIQQGATVAQRIGNKVVVKSIHLKCNLGGVAGNLAAARIMLVYDKQPNGAFPAITDILLDQPAGAANFFSSLNIANKSRFQVIRDGFYNLDAAQSLIHTLNIYCKGRWECEYGANAGTIGDFRTGAIYLIGIYTSSQVTMSTGDVRIRYFD